MLASARRSALSTTGMGLWVDALYWLLKAALWNEIRLAPQLPGEHGRDILHDCNDPDPIFITLWAL